MRWGQRGYMFTASQLRNAEFRFEFWSLVEIGADDECWPWLRPPDDHGYGRIGVGGRNMRAHRVAFALYHDTDVLPADHVLHRCDNPACCNGRHLTLGDQVTNNREMRERGRGRESQRQNRRRGARHPQAMAAARRAEGK